jgi:hypothetical protein
MSFIRSRVLIAVTMVCLSASLMALSVKHGHAEGSNQGTEAEQNLSEEEIKQFLLTAKIIKSKQTSTGVTRPYELTLSDGKLIHEAGFQSINVFKNFERLDNGTVENNFRDTYHFNIAAYELAKMLGLQMMMPVTVERKWRGKKGSLSWWIDKQMDDRERFTKNIPIPDPQSYNKQMHSIMIFSQLVYDVDRNRTNVLIGKNWELYMIDFSRAFRLHKKLPHPEDLAWCNRQLLERLRRLDRAEVQSRCKGHLEKAEIDALMARRDLIVAHFDQLISEKGENEVLY